MASFVPSNSSMFDVVKPLEAPISAFDWAEAPPLSSVWWPVVGGAVYAAVVLTVVFRRRAAASDTSTRPDTSKTVKHRRSKALTWVLVAHNSVLAAASLAMLCGFLSQAWARARAEGSALYLVCESPTTRATGPLFAWSYLFYLSKYAEFLDTGLTLAKGSSPRHLRLHVFHHSFVPFMAWLWLEQAQSLQFIGGAFNTLVHTVMYSYFALSALGIRVWWKRYITVLQNVQFVTSLVFLVWTCVLMANGAECAGASGLAFGAVFNTLLLVQFYAVLQAGSKGKRQAGRGPAGRKGGVATAAAAAAARPKVE